MSIFSILSVLSVLSEYEYLLFEYYSNTELFAHLCIGRYWLILGGTGSIWSGTGWYSCSGSESESPMLLLRTGSEKVGWWRCCWVSSRSGWLLELLTELTTINGRHSTKKLLQRPIEHGFIINFCLAISTTYLSQNRGCNRGADKSIWPACCWSAIKILI